MILAGSSLAHQGDIYSASFAAVPHVVECLSQAPTKADSAYFQFPAWIAVCRQRNAVPIPDGLEADYFAALDRLPSLVAAAAALGNWDSGFLCSALSAMAASKRFGAVAEAVLEMNTEVAEDRILGKHGRIGAVLTSTELTGGPTELSELHVPV